MWVWGFSPYVKCVCLCVCVYVFVCVLVCVLVCGHVVCALCVLPCFCMFFLLSVCWVLVVVAVFEGLAIV